METTHSVMHTDIYTHSHIHTYSHTLTLPHTPTHTQVHTHTHLIHTRILLLTQVHLHTHTLTHTQLHLHTYTPRCTCTHTPAHTYTHSRNSLSSFQTAAILLASCPKAGIDSFLYIFVLQETVAGGSGQYYQSPGSNEGPHPSFGLLTSKPIPHSRVSFPGHRLTLDNPCSHFVTASSVPPVRQGEGTACLCPQALHSCLSLGRRI